MRTLIVIPARHASSRYPGKPLVPLRGATGVAKTLVQRAYEAARSVGVDVVVATDDARIADHAARFGADVAMTSPACRNGTERTAEVAAARDADLYVNLQGDAPLTPKDFVTALIAGIGDAPVATPVLACDATTLARFREDRQAGRVGGTTAVFDRNGNALYFSKEVLPYADRLGANEAGAVFHHVGLYAYTRAALEAYAAAPEGRLEAIEGLEQLRFLEIGWPVRCVEVAAKGRPFWELNNPVDAPRVEAALAALNIE